MTEWRCTACLLTIDGHLVVRQQLKHLFVDSNFLFFLLVDGNEWFEDLESRLARMYTGRLMSSLFVKRSRPLTSKSCIDTLHWPVYDTHKHTQPRPPVNNCSPKRPGIHRTRQRIFKTVSRRRRRRIIKLLSKQSMLTINSPQEGLVWNSRVH